MAKLQKGLICLRPHVDVRKDFEELLVWCEEHDMHFSTIINSFIPAISYAVKNQMMIHHGKRYVRADFGDIYIRKPGVRRKAL